MSNPARPPKEPTAEQLKYAEVPQAYFPEGNLGTFAADHKPLDKARGVLAGLDMEMRPSVILPRNHVREESILMRTDPELLALAKSGKPVPRPRTVFAMRLLRSVYPLLPVTGYCSQFVCRSAMVNKVYVDGGVECALGRLRMAYPRKDRGAVVPISRSEAADAVRNCGILMTGLSADALRKYPLVPKEGDTAGITVNPNSDNGFPVCGKWTTLGAASECMRLAVDVRRELERAPSVYDWVRSNELKRPWLVAVKGKAKADYYPQEKVVEGRMRFYNAFPRQIVLNMQVATQVMELNARHITAGGTSRSGIGITLVRGGAADLVQALDSMLSRLGHAYVHVGDDSWVVVRVDGSLVMFALDCSNFDLTQRAEVTLEVHRAIRDQLRLIDEIAAELWFAYARERLVVTVKSAAYQFKHAGPSGMPLQSKVNDALMDVMIRRAVEGLRSSLEEDVAAAVASAGASMGFVVKLEQYWRGWGVDSVREALASRPFLFLGYYFHVREDLVQVHCDLPRTLAQVPYPSTKWVAQKGQLLAMEAMRLGSIALNMGIPTVELGDAFAMFRAEAARLVREAIQTFGDLVDPKLRWAVQENPFTTSTEPSLKGLLRALDRSPHELWSKPGYDADIRTTEISWADEVEEAELADARALGVNPNALLRPAAASYVPRPLPPGRSSVPPVTVGNHGRYPALRVRVQRRQEGLGGLVAVARPRRTPARLLRLADFGSSDSSSELGSVWSDDTWWSQE